MKKFKGLGVALAAAATVFMSGCSEEKQEIKVETSAFESSLLLTAKPEGAVSVVEARAKMQKGGQVVVAGDIGGRVPPFVEKRAAFVLADQKNITSCDKKHGDACKRPWDYCCDDPKKIAESIMIVQVLDSNGKVVKQTLKGWNQLKELSSVVIRGTYDKSSTESNVIINATGIYCEK